MDVSLLVLTGMFLFPGHYHPTGPGFLQLKEPDQFNFMNTVLRKYELAPDTQTEDNAPPNMIISEGSLSPSPPRLQSDSSIASSYAGVVDSKTYSKKNL